MRRFSRYELEKFCLLDKEIQDEVHHERALRAIRKLSGPIREDGQEVEMPPAVVAVCQALVDRVVAYEKKEYPFGEPNFEEWSAGRTDKQWEQKVAAIEQAEALVDKMEAFEQQRKARIKERLKARGQKQQDLARILRKDKTYVSHLLNGRSPFTIEVVARLHDQLGIPFEDLVPPSIAFDAFQK